MKKIRVRRKSTPVILQCGDRRWLCVKSGGAYFPAVFREGAVLSEFGEKSLDHFDTEEELSGLSVVRMKVKSWRATSDIDKKRAVVTDKDGHVVDYRDVTIKGYLSTFENYTLKDRDGEYVRKNAFDKSINSFMKNPVLLVDHNQTVESLAGSFTSLTPDANGLMSIGKISNAPDMMSIRFKVAENHLRTLSMGGLFLYGEDGKAIDEVDLWEGSLVPIPSNPDASFSVRSMDAIVSEKAFRKSASLYGEFRGK